MSRCRHTDARQSDRFDNHTWLWCPDCRTHIRRNETRPGIGDGR